MKRRNPLLSAFQSEIACCLLLQGTHTCSRAPPSLFPGAQPWPHFALGTGDGAHRGAAWCHLHRPLVPQRCSQRISGPTACKVVWQPAAPAELWFSLHLLLLLFELPCSHTLQGFYSTASWAVEIRTGFLTRSACASAQWWVPHSSSRSEKILERLFWKGLDWSQNE